MLSTKVIKELLVWSRDTFLLLIDLVKMRSNLSVREDSYQRLLSAFFLTGGVVNSFASRLLGKPKILFQNKGLLSKYSSTEIDEYSQHLQNQGYVVFENVLTWDLCQEFIALTESIPGVTRKMDEGVGVEKLEIFDRNSPSSVRVDYTAQSLVEQRIVQDLISDPSLLNFAQNYLGSAPILDLVAMWWHTTFAKNPDKQAAQWFHFDMDRTRWIKFFFYLTDVDENSGPHTFVPKSHKAFGIPFRLRRKGYIRLSDELVGSYFPPTSWKEFTGKRGTLIVEDTRGLHKGKHCIENDRLLFQLEFTSTGFGVSAPAMTLDSRAMSESLQKMNHQNPIIYSLCNFNNHN